MDSLRSIAEFFVTNPIFRISFSLSAGVIVGLWTNQCLQQSRLETDSLLTKSAPFLAGLVASAVTYGLLEVENYLWNSN